MWEQFPSLFEPSGISLSLLSRTKVLLVVDAPPGHFCVPVFFSSVRAFLQQPQVIYDLLVLTVRSPGRLFGFYARFLVLELLKLE